MGWLSLLALPASAQWAATRGDEPESMATEPAVEEVPELTPLDDGRLRTMFLAGVGMLALPAAEVCPSTQAECEPGEAGLSLSLSALGYIFDIAAGARVAYVAGLRPTTAAGDESGELGREHVRTYFLVEGEFRYYLPPIGDWGVWIGATSGLVVINDSWTTLADREPASDTDFVGPKAMSLSSEGLTLGVGAGGHWRLAENWLFGTQFRYANWILPTERARTPVGDLASFAGRVDVIDLGVYGGFVLPL